jgi:hypothetical protein
MINLPEKWLKVLETEPETGMGYQVATVLLSNGQRFDQVVIVEGQVTKVRGFADIPFSAGQIVNIVLTHDDWDFNADR